MAAYDIQKHFKGLRTTRGGGKGRSDPFATGFEDDSDHEGRQRRSRSNTKEAATAVDRSLDSASASAVASKRLPTASDLFRDFDDDFLGPPKRSDRRPSPAPATLSSTRVSDGAARRGSLDVGVLSKSAPGKGAPPFRDPRAAVVQAAGTLALLDDSDSEEDLAPRSRRADRYPSPAPRKRSDPINPAARSATPRGARSSTPRGTREAGAAETSTSTSGGLLQPPPHSVASPFAGTKYLQDSESDSEDEEEAVASPGTSSLDAILFERSNSPETIKRVDKPRPQNGGGVSWRAFSEGRAEQRHQEIEALQTSLKQRGKSISFGSHALTDDGNRIPVQPAPAQIFAGARGRGRKGSRGKSPPRRAEDTRPAEDELADGGAGLGIYDPAQFKTNPFTGEPVRRTSSNNPESKETAT